MRLYGLIGFPLQQSFSQQFFREKFVAEGIADADFELLALQEIDDFPKLLQQHPRLRGLAVTIPHKTSVIKFLDELDEEAAAIGAVNCIRFCNGKLKGYNTDVTGFENSIEPLLQPQHTSALVLGNGGASKAVQFVLRKKSIPFKTVSRRPGTADLTYEDLTTQLITENRVIINTTPLGMFPGVKGFPQIPYNAIGSNHLLYDLVYKPAETLFLQKGKAQGAVIKNGFEMLVLQAEENWKIWNAGNQD